MTTTLFPAIITLRSSGLIITDGVIFIYGLPYDVAIIHGYISIGCKRHSITCQNHPISAWKAFSDEEIANMGGDVLGFWKSNQQQILAIADALKDMPPASPQ